MKIDIRKFVPKEVFAIFGEASAQFVSDNVIKMYEFIDVFFTNHFKDLDSNVEVVEILINNWHQNGSFNNRGLRTFDYIKSQLDKGIKTAKLSQHVGGSTNAIDFNVVLHFKGAKTLCINSDTIHDLITKNEKVFLEAGLTTLEDKAITQGWTHADCRFTGKSNIHIVKP